jgi:hypothetical protein
LRVKRISVPSLRRADSISALNIKSLKIASTPDL